MAVEVRDIKLSFMLNVNCRHGLSHCIGKLNIEIVRAVHLVAFAGHRRWQRPSFHEVGITVQNLWMWTLSS